MEEILDYVIWEIRRSGFDGKLIGGIVLTGGGSLLNHVGELCQLHTGIETRIGMPIERLAHGYSKHLSSPIYATGIGLLLKGIEDLSSGAIEYPEEVFEVPKVEEQTEDPVATKAELEDKWYEQIFKKTKEWFETEPDSKF